MLIVRESPSCSNVDRFGSFIRLVSTCYVDRICRWLNTFWPVRRRMWWWTWPVSGWFWWWSGIAVERLHQMLWRHATRMLAWRRKILIEWGSLVHVLLMWGRRTRLRRRGLSIWRCYAHGWILLRGVLHLTRKMIKTFFVQWMLSNEEKTK